MISSLASCQSRFPYLTHDHSRAIYCVYGSHIKSTLWELGRQRQRTNFKKSKVAHPFQEDEIIF